MSVKRAALTFAACTGLARAARAATAGQLRILCYHGLWMFPGKPYGSCLFMTPALFDARMARLKQSGQPVLSLGEAVARLDANDLPPGATVITIDDGWTSTFTHMLPTLERYALPATLYVTSWYAGRDLPVINVAADYIITQAGRSDIDKRAVIRRIEACPEHERLDALRAFGRELGVSEAWLNARQFHLMQADEIAAAHRRGLDMQLHTHRHIDVRQHVGRLPTEVVENRAFLERVTGADGLEHFCYPSGTFHPEAPALLQATGVRSATLVAEGLNAPGCNPLELRRFVDGQAVSGVEFDAYLSGTLHYLSGVRRLPARVQAELPARVAAASSMLLCAVN